MSRFLCSLVGIVKDQENPDFCHPGMHVYFPYNPVGGSGMSGNHPVGPEFNLFMYNSKRFKSLKYLFCCFCVKYLSQKARYLITHRAINRFEKSLFISCLDMKQIT